MSTPAAVFLLLLAQLAAEPKPVALRAEHFPVLPSHLAVTHVIVENLQATPYDGLLSLAGPAGWRIVPTQKPIQLAPHQTLRVPFSVEKAQENPANVYCLEMTATAGGAKTTRTQNTYCSSAPYFKPTIDGDVSDWKDAIPVTFLTAGKKTTISSYWNRNHLSLLVAVEEEKLLPWTPAASSCDAVQIAIAAKDTVTGRQPDQPVTRYEYLLVATADAGQGKCFALAQPGLSLGQAQKAAALGDREYAQAKVAVRREGMTTYYECAIPWKPLKEAIRPSEGREFCLSLLVHDPDGTGLRDWGAAAGLAESQRNALAWSGWQGAVWGPVPPYDNKIEWGLCASKY